MNEHNLKEDIFNILRILSSNTTLTQRQISNFLGISLGKTNYLLRALMGRGLVKMKNFATNKGKIKKVRYILTKKGIEEKIKLTRFFLEKKEKEYLELKRELESTLNLEFKI